MGGRALKELSIERISKDEYFQIWDELKVRLVKLFKDDVSLVKAYHNKEDFGDMDILVKRSSLNQGIDFREAINKEFFPRRIKINGSVLSFDYKNFQIDLISTKESCYDSSVFFYSYNDFGLLLGKLAHYNKLKVGFCGMSITKYSKDRSKKLLEENITKNPRVICEYFELSYDRWLQGFDDLEDVFEYIGTSKYYTKEAFDPKNWNANQRHRDTKRDNIHKFVDYMDTLESNDYPRPTRDEKFKEIDELFPELNLWSKYQNVLKLEELRVKSSEIFNGHMISDRYNVEGPDIGKIIVEFKSQFDNKEQMYLFILQKPHEFYQMLDDIVNELKIN